MKRWRKKQKVLFEKPGDKKFVCNMVCKVDGKPRKFLKAKAVKFKSQHSPEPRTEQVNVDRSPTATSLQELLLASVCEMETGLATASLLKNEGEKAASHIK